jgi:hypothetical protein
MVEYWLGQERDATGAFRIGALQYQRGGEDDIEWPRERFDALKNDHASKNHIAL